LGYGGALRRRLIAMELQDRYRCSINASLHLGQRRVDEQPDRADERRYLLE